MSGSLLKQIEKKLQSGFEISYLNVLNESHNHSVPANSETHFKVTLVSADFDGLRKVMRHQQVYKLLAHELENGVHALALHLYTPSEWREAEIAPASPNCMGGSKRGAE
jgi:BolA protein